MDPRHRRVVLVSGATGGIGSAVVRDLAADSTVVMLGRSRARLEQARDELGDGVPADRLHPVEADINRGSSVDEAVAQIARDLGRIDALVHCAGDGPFGSLAETTEEMWQTTLNAKFLGAVRLVRAASPYMPDSTSAIALVSGTFRKDPHPDFPVNSAVNAALGAFAKAVSKDLGRRGIRVNVIDPGVTVTPLWTQTAKEIAARADITPEQVDAQLLAGTPLGRFTTPADVAHTVRFLLSAGAANVTGTSIALDGGAAAAL